MLTKVINFIENKPEKTKFLFKKLIEEEFGLKKNN
jgi:hypothetical protein